MRGILRPPRLLEGRPVMTARTASRLGLVLVVVLLSGSPGRAQEKAPAYPRVNVATAYAVDPHWPERPASMPLGETPGIAVDAQDQVWVFTRAVPPVQVY